mgnify:CR=1 FL=1
MSGNTLARYNGLAISLHWVSAILVLVAITLIEIKGWFPKGSALRDGVKLWHYQAGALVLLATLLRVIWLVVSRRPEPVAPKGSMERILGASAHGLLYLLLLALPLSGVMILIAAGNPVTLLGWDLPIWTEGVRDTAKAVKKLHELFGNAIIGLVIFHVAAALWHQFVRRDGLMLRMMPERMQS